MQILFSDRPVHLLALHRHSDRTKTLLFGVFPMRAFRFPLEILARNEAGFVPDPAKLRPMADALAAISHRGSI
jgi:hypothetical protein